MTNMCCVYLLCLVTMFSFFGSYRKKYLIQFIYLFPMIIALFIYYVTFRGCPFISILTTEWVEFQLSICCLVSQFQVLVFFAIAEYGLLLHTKSHRSKIYEISPQQPNDKHGCIKIGKKKFSMPLLDKIAIVVLPLLFIMFNVIYWSVYTTWIPYARHHKPLLIWSRSRI